MADGLASRNGGKAGLAILVAVLLLGLGLRLDYAWKGRAPVYDAAAYAKIAANLDAGEGFTLGPGATQPADNYSPGLPLAVAALYKASGGVHERLARIFLALVGSLAILFAYLIGRRLAGPPAGLVGAAIVAVYPALLEYQGMLMSEPLAATLLSGAVLSMLWASDRGSALRPRARGASWAWLAPGACLGALALVRPEYLGVAALLALVVFARRARLDWRASLAQAAILIAGVILVIAPWTVRNAVALDRFVPVSTGGGQVLFAGTYLPSDGDPEAVGAEVVARHPEIFSPADARRLRLEQILARLAAQRYPGVESDRALARMGRQQLWDDLTEEPLEYAGFLAAKIGRVWLHGPRAVMREPLWSAFHLLLVGLALLGLGLLAGQRRWEALLIGSVLLAITAISTLLVASP
ncbi:MAG TPA: glycosyltransferase family 39 protein, partial [Solirubrobacterales bacterium]|nr:glycosyltransferase family 39 protein [Solirubrobacterales bacterium]